MDSPVSTGVPRLPEPSAPVGAGKGREIRGPGCPQLGWRLDGMGVRESLCGGLGNPGLGSREPLHGLEVHPVLG